MTALTADRNTVRRAGDRRSLPVATTIKIYAGALVALNAGGYATKGAAATTLKAVGVAEELADNTSGGNGAITVKVRNDGWYRFANSSAGDAITLADVGASCYIVDDQTVAKTDGSASRSVAGKVRDVDADGVWIEFV